MMLILIGKCAAGKDTIAAELLKRGFKPLISHTSRPMREGEVDGREYHFVSSKEFEDLIENDRMLEYREYHTTVNGVPDKWYYGLSKQPLEPDVNYVTVVDTLGARELLAYYGRDISKVVEVRTDDNIRKRRAITRGSFDETEWDRRFADDVIRFSEKETKPLVNDIVFNNGTISETMEQIERIL